MASSPNVIPNAEIRARLVTLEVIAVTSLGLYLANAKNDPDSNYVVDKHAPDR
jgi:hypothetical protein